MKIEKTEVYGFVPALRGMRNPMDSWDRSSTNYMEDSFGDQIGTYIDEVDFVLSRKLTKAGTEHCKHLRMIGVWVDLTLPRYIWSEFDTYRHNTKISCSTIHTIHKRHLTEDDFEGGVSYQSLSEINFMIDEFNTLSDVEEKNKLRRKIKASLPEGFLQKRTVYTNYAELLNIYYQRRNHKLPEWHTICDWIINLPYFKELTGVE